MKKLLAPVAATTAVIGLAGFSLIQQSEGVRFKPYRDVVGVWTVCYGHTGADIIRDKTYTEAECQALLIRDIDKHSPVIRRGDPQNCIANAPLTNNQRDALLSFTFNVGTSAFCKSTMAKRLAARDYIGAADQFPKWNRAGGRVYPGLTKRRLCERELFVTYQRSDASNVLALRAKGCLTASVEQS